MTFISETKKYLITELKPFYLKRRVHFKSFRCELFLAAFVLSGMTKLLPPLGSKNNYRSVIHQVFY